MATDSGVPSMAFARAHTHTRTDKHTTRTHTHHYTPHSCKNESINGKSRCTVGNAGLPWPCQIRTRFGSEQQPRQPTPGPQHATLTLLEEEGRKRGGEGASETVSKNPGASSITITSLCHTLSLTPSTVRHPPCSVRERGSEREGAGEGEGVALLLQIHTSQDHHPPPHSPPTSSPFADIKSELREGRSPRTQ